MEDSKETSRNNPSENPETTRKYEREISDYIHFQIEETQAPESAFEQKVVPESIREQGFWRRFHVRRRIFVSRTADFFKDTKKMVVVWIIIMALVAIGSYFGWDREMVGGAVVFFGLISSAFSWLAAVILGGIGLIPFIGPVLVAILSSSLLWIINGLGYFVSVVAIRAGHGKAVLNYRLLVIIFLCGIVTGYVIAKIVH